MTKKISNGLILLLCLGFNSKLLAQVKTIEVNKNWVFTEAGKNTWLPATVPGCVHTDLLDNKKIDDPFFRLNEKKLQWIDKTDWEYKTTFTASKEILDMGNIRLYFKGLDTHADVYLNDSLLLKTDNMFREWKVDCKKILKPENNLLRIVFHSPIKFGLSKLEELGFQPPASNDQSENGELGDKKVSIFSRKAPYQFGWDWGPRLVTSGIWRPVYIEAWNDARIENVQFQINNLNPQKASITATIEVLSEKPDNISVVITDATNSKPLSAFSSKLKQGNNKVSFLVTIDNPKLWWTNGLGEPYLYKLKTELQKDRKPIDQQIQNIGLRTVKIIQKPDSIGKSFYVELNGLRVFMKGADYIPNDIFPTRVKPATYEKILRSAVDAHMNMLRLWGGGIYENDIFYDLCDQKGILIWHDFMFACSMYPAYKGFIENVKQEFVDNVKRLRNHPCIALWCGNNEIDAAWAEGNEKGGWNWKTKFNPEQRKYLWDSYKKIFYETLPEVLQELDSSRFYWPSSPISEYKSYGISNLKSGDLHYWGVWHGKQPFESFLVNTGRFMSEYGFQSFPDFKTVRSYSLPGDWNIESEVMSAHQRSGTGNLLIKKYMDMYYKTPKDFESFLYVSQVQQAEAIRSAIETHRISMPYCMGTLYWQLNDCWPVASWSSIDYYNHWKALHYFAKKAYKTVIIVPMLKDNKIETTVVSDSLGEFNAFIKYSLIDINNKVLKTFRVDAKILKNNVTKTTSIGFDTLLNGRNPEEFFLCAEIWSSNRKLADNILYFTAAKNLRLQKPEIAMKIVQSGKDYIISLSSDKLAKNVYLSIDFEGHFSDNYFDLLPNTPVTLTFKPDSLVADFEKLLIIKSLVDTY